MNLKYKFYIFKRLLEASYTLSNVRKERSWEYLILLVWSLQETLGTRTSNSLSSFVKMSLYFQKYVPSSTFDDFSYFYPILTYIKKYKFVHCILAVSTMLFFYKHIKGFLIIHSFTIRPFSKFYISLSA